MDLLAVQGTLKSLLQYHSSKASILQHSDFFIVQLSHPFMTTGKTIALTRQNFVGKVISLLFNMLSRFVITFLPRSKCLLISWLQSPSAVILEPKKTQVTQAQSEKGHGQIPSNVYLYYLCSAETWAEASSSKPLLLHPHAGRGHRGQSAPVSSAGHRHGGKSEADRPVLKEGCPGRESYH